MIEIINAVRAWLGAINPDLPAATFVVVVFLIVLGIRKAFPNSWEKWAAVVPVLDIDPSPVLVILSKLWQAIPAAVIGAALGALQSGANVKATVYGALLALIAPVAHELAKNYQGKVGSPSSPPNSDDSKPVAAVHVKFPRRDEEPPNSVAMSRLRRRRALPRFIPALGLLMLPVGCSLFQADWPTKVEACATPLEQPLEQIVAGILAGKGDVETELVAVAKDYGGDAVICAVKALVGALGLTPATDQAVRQRARGQAFLAKVHAQ